MAILIHYWLDEEPAEDLEAFASQAARAKWLEDRVFQNLANIIGKVMGGK